MSEWAERTQSVTLATADAWGEPWTGDEVEFVLAFTDDVSDEEIATTLGRTLYAVWGIQNRLRENNYDASRVVAQRRVARVERTYTFIDGDCPDDW